MMTVKSEGYIPVSAEGISLITQDILFQPEKLLAMMKPTLDSCEKIVLVDGWQKSAAAVAMHDYMVKNGKPVLKIKLLSSEWN